MRRWGAFSTTRSSPKTRGGLDIPELLPNDFLGLNNGFGGFGECLPEGGSTGDSWRSGISSLYTVRFAYPEDFFFF